MLEDETHVDVPAGGDEGGEERPDHAQSRPRTPRRSATRAAGPPPSVANPFLVPESELAAPAPVPVKVATVPLPAVFKTPELPLPQPAAALEDAAERPGSRRRRGRGRAAADDAGEQPESVGPDQGAQLSPDAGDVAPEPEPESAELGSDEEARPEAGGQQPATKKRRRRRRGGGDGAGSSQAEQDADPNTVVKVRAPREVDPSDKVTGVKGSTRLEAKRQRRRVGLEAGRRRAPILSEAEFLARRESVERAMVVRQHDEITQIAVLEDGILVEHYVAKDSGTPASMVGNVYLGRVQNVLPSMEAAFVDIGRGRNGVLYAGEVNWDAAGLEGQQKRIELALKPGDSVLVQVTKDPIGHKGARLTSQVSLPGRYLVLVPDGSMTGISRKLPDTERARLRSILKRNVPDDVGVIVRTAAEGASEEELVRDIARLTKTWEDIQRKAGSASPPKLLNAEPDLAIRVVRDIFNEDFASLQISGETVWDQISEYLQAVAPDLAARASKWTGSDEIFAHHRVDEQLAKALDRKVWLPSGGSLIIEHTEAMTVIDVNTGKFTGQGGDLEETVTQNNLEAAEEIVRQIRLRDIGGIIIIDFIDMVLPSNQDLVLRRLVECLSRDRTKHQVTEITSLGLAQMTRKRIGGGLLETFSESCEACNGRGVRIHMDSIGAPSAGRRRPVKPSGAHDPVETMLQATQPEQDAQPPSQDGGEPTQEAHAEAVAGEEPLPQLAEAEVTAVAPQFDPPAGDSVP